MMDAKSHAETIITYMDCGSCQYTVEMRQQMTSLIAAEIEAACADARREALEEAAKVFDYTVELLQHQFEASGGVAVKRDLDIYLRAQERIRALSNQEPKPSGEKPATEREG
jgi:hypothetical protein